MVRLEFLIFGYRRITYKNGAELAATLEILMRLGIGAQTVGERELYISERDYSRNIDNNQWQNAENISQPRGLVAAVRALLGRRSLLLAILFASAVVVLSPSLVWDVRVLGNERVSEADIKDSLDSAGLYVGRPWRSIDRSEVETRMLSECPEISWISINRRGSVAYVEVIESELPPDTEKPPEYANIVAASDCVITEISVVSGYAAVSVGEVVKAGDVLISGVIPSEARGGFCSAEGSVKGIVDDEISVFIEREYTEKLYSDGKNTALKIKILNFPINIFKIYGNSGDKCDIIEFNEVCRFLGRYEIPVFVLREYTLPYEEAVIRRTDAELVSFAGERMRAAILARTTNGELARASSSGRFLDGGYTMTTKLSVVEEIGTTVPFALDE